MWIQEPDRERQRPPEPEKDINMVNNRGRVIQVTHDEAQKLIAQGFSRAPKSSKPGDYIPVFDRGEQTRNDQVTVKGQEIANLPDLLRVLEIK